MAELPAESRPDTPDDLVLVGQIGQPFGIKGWLHIYPYSIEADALLGTGLWWLGKSEKNWQDWRTAEIQDVKPHGAGIVVHLAGVDTREQAELLRNTKIAVARATFPPVEKDEYYWVDLIGLAVENVQGRHLGVVVGLLDNGAHSILQVELPTNTAASTATQNALEMPAEAKVKATKASGKKPKKIEPELIPFVDKHVLSVDLAAKKMVVDWELEIDHRSDHNESS